MRFKRSEGMTPSERILADLCDRSFLKLWTYPNLFRKPGKELTDLLVVFGRDVIIFEDKSCAYPNTGNPTLDWSRWYNRSIAYSAGQIAKAERWVRKFPDRVFLDAKCTVPLPLKIPPAAEMRIHRVCVALGAVERAAAATGTRALTVYPTVANDAEPFTVGRTDQARGWVHVFDEASLATVLGELSTISDFVHYLESKTALFDAGKFMFADSETDIMAYYLWNGRTFPPSEQPFRLEPNLWARVEASPEFLAGRQENEIGVFWDNLIEYITDEYLNETLEFGNELEISEHEQLVRIMAGETRFFRRILSKVILEKAELARVKAICSLVPSGQPDVNYVLYIGRGDQGGDHAEYRADRASQLRGRCFAAKAVKPDKRFIIGIALDARGVRGSSEDFLFVDTQNWSADDVARAQALGEELGYFMPDQAIETHVVEDEYPGT